MQQKPILGQGQPVTGGQPAEDSVPQMPAGPGSGAQPIEIGGRDGSNGLDPARYGDWEKNGRCIDF